MAPRRSATGKKKMMTRRRKFYRKSSLNRIENQSHQFVRSAYYPSALTSTALFSGFGGASKTVLSQLPNYTEFSALFDQYKIKKVQYTYIPRYDSADISQYNNLTLPRLFYVIDRDDAAAPSGINDLMQYANVRSVQFNKPITVTYVPSVSGLVYQTGVASGYAPKSKQWLDLASTDVEHYGHKFWIDLHTSNFGSNFKVDIQIRVWIDCKNLR